MNIEYIGEHLWPGRIGDFFVYLSFVAALLSSLSYFISSQNNNLDPSWKKLARLSFKVHSFSVFGIVAVLFFLLFNHYFEYHYIWQHSSRDMPMRYILSCFWEGQEGSFLLWTFWHVILGLVLMKKEKEWEAPVMTTFSLVQAFLTSMLLGVVVFGYKLGSNPFMLLREHPDFINLPFVKIPTYLSTLEGRGLNPLLQNYWMTIHPPTLFLGFALTLVPFAYGVAGLWTRKYSKWMKPALPWTFSGIMILGAGILMGGAWAYESLSFGGFWAWDPVENASLVPWLTLIAAGHLMLVNKKNGSSVFATYLMTSITFIFILYSTFLTRSGILGESSVHAFTDLGMMKQLLVYLLFFIYLSVILVLKNKRVQFIYTAISVVSFFTGIVFAILPSWSLGFWIASSGFMLIFGYYKYFPKESGDENISSREFWMFIGALILLLSSFQIIFSTSTPVINKILGTNFAQPLDVIGHYNSWQMPFASVVALLIAIGQFLKYKSTKITDFLKKIVPSLAISFTISLYWAFELEMFNVSYFLLLFASLFAVIANLDFFVRFLKGKLNHIGASVAHIGFGLILLGALISTSKSVIISQNTSGVDVKALGSDFNNNENIMLTKGDTLRMGGYFVTYKGQKKDGINILYEIEYLTKNPDDSYTSEFVLNPFIQLNPRMGNVAEPDTRHFINRDVYTHITYAEIDPKENDNSDYGVPNTIKVAVGDTFFSSQSIIVFEGIVKDIDKAGYNLLADDVAVAARLKVIDINGKVYYANPIFAIRENYIIPVESIVDEVGIKVIFDMIDTAENKFRLNIYEKKNYRAEFIVMKAIIFPFINILWAGCIIMILGSTMAIIYRVKK